VNPSAETLDRVPSLCPTCGTQVVAEILEHDGQIYQRSLCPEHGHEPQLIFSHAGLYRRLQAWNVAVFGAPGPAADASSDDDSDGKAPLLAVVDLTNQCNFRCPVCFAETSTKGPVYYLDLDTVRRMLSALLARGPVPCRHIQFSGGEPTLHPQFLDILRMARDMGFNHIQVATNGSRFGSGEFVERCEEAGLHTLYLQFDGMTDDVYLKLRGQRLLEQKVRVVENVGHSGLRLVLVPTITPGVNVDQIGPIFRFALGHSRHVTGISIQPIADTGRVGLSPSAGRFNLADMAEEFGLQTGLTRFPDDWFPLNGLTLLTRAVSRLRSDPVQNPACDAQCSVGTYFYVDDEDRPTCLTRFLDLEKLLNTAAQLKPATGGVIHRQVSRLRQFNDLAATFDSSQAPHGLTFERLLRGLDGWEDKAVGRGREWFRRGFNGMFVAGMHFMDASNYSYRRVRRCIIKYVTVDGDVVSFCRYNAGERLRSVEEASRLLNSPRPL
jgi:7,8-dihydro-6-hydroxymethylpterin dimethyltransferase